MTEAKSGDKGLVIDILTAAFKDNLSVNYLIPADARKHERVRALMDYSYETCKLFGKVYLSDDRKGCALVSFPERKKTTLKALWLEVKLIWNGIGLGNISKPINREKEISKNYPGSQFYYLWFIGVHPDSQNYGVGRKLMMELLDEAKRLGRPIYLETSTTKNIPWYKKFGLNVYNQLDFGYTLFLIRNDQ